MISIQVKRIVPYILSATILHMVPGVAVIDAADFFISAGGSPQGNGTMSQPWGLFETLKSPPTAIRPGDTLYLLPGTYVAPNRSYFFSRLAGAANSSIVVRPYDDARVTIIGGIQVEGSWVIFRDLEITNINTQRKSSQTGSFPTDVNTIHGFNVYAPNVKVINNIIHDNGSGMSAWMSAPDTELSGNIVYYNGWQASDRSHGHGLYAQNEAGSKRINDNIIFNQFARGIQFYGSGDAFLRNCYLTGNIIFNNGALSDSGGDRNILIGGGRVAENPVVNNNYSYSDPAGSAGDVNVGYWPFGSGCTNLQLNNNYFVSGGRGLVLHECSIRSMSGNTIVADTLGFNPAEYPSNSYINPVTKPKGVAAFVRRNKHEPGRANIVVYNWDRSPTVHVDISNIGLAIGDQYELRNVQDYYRDSFSGVYSGGPVAIPMTGRTVAKPIGWAAPASTFPEFGVFVLKRTGAGVVPSDTGPPDVTVRWPVNGSTVTGAVEVLAVASDDIEVRGVRFELDGNRLGSEDPTAPYAVELNAENLSPGEHTIVAIARDAAGNQGVSRPAAFRVSSPDDSPADDSSSAGGETVSPSSDKYSTLIEAEAGRRANSLVAQDPDALGGRYVHPISSGVGMVEFRIPIETDGNYTLWARTLMPDAASDLLTVTVDGAGAMPLSGSATWSARWRWIRLQNGSAPRALSLRAGLRILTFDFPEDGVQLDAFILTNDMGYAPTGGPTSAVPEEDPNSAVQDLPTTAAPPVRTGGSPSGVLPADTTQTTLRLHTDKPAVCRYAVSPAIPYSSSTGTSPFSQTGTTTHTTFVTGLLPGRSYAYYCKCADPEGNYNVDDYLIQFSTAERTPSTTSNPAVLVYVEAESGSRRSMVISRTSAAFGNRYVYARQDGVGSVLFQVRVPSAGTYAVWGRVFSPDQSRDSLALSVNGGPTIEYDTAQRSWTSSWRWSRALVSVDLIEGLNAIEFFAREPNTLLDGFVVVNDLQFTLTDGAVQD